VSGVGESERPRLSVGAAALGDHARVCQRCLAVARAGLPYVRLCAYGRVLAEAALKARARRAS